MANRFLLVIIAVWIVCLLSMPCSAAEASVKAEESSYSCENPDAQVLILGAGMTGIAAAYSLHINGTTNFIILEAQDRIGGRMRTDTFAGVRVNTGAGCKASNTGAGCKASTQKTQAGESAYITFWFTSMSCGLLIFYHRSCLPMVYSLYMYSIL